MCAELIQSLPTVSKEWFVNSILIRNSTLGMCYSSYLFSSVSWHLTIKGRTRLRGTVSPSLCGTNLSIQTIRLSGEPREVCVIGWWLRGASQQALGKRTSGPVATHSTSMQLMTPRVGSKVRMFTIYRPSGKCDIFGC